MEDMLALKWIIKKPLFWLLFILILLTACTQRNAPLPEVVNSPRPLTPTVTSIPTTPEEPTPTPTSIPAAALVNDEPIPLTWFEREVERYTLAQSAQGIDDVDAEAARQTVLNDLIDQMLLAQAAREAGVQFSEADVQARIDQLEGQVDLEAWMGDWGYTRVELFEQLQFQMLVANQRDRIAATIPESVEQVELRQVFAFTEAGANRALADLDAGIPFENVALEFDPETGGYLGWVPRGYLLIPAVEAVVFDQPVGTYTEIIESELGYHILLVIDREVHPLTMDARLALARHALHAWLEDWRAASDIEVLVD